MISYQTAVRLLSVQNTHLPLRERCRLALRQLSSPRPSQEYLRDLQLVLYRRKYAVEYQQRHFPEWYDIPEEIREQMLNDYPLSGHGVAQMNTMLYLERTAREEEAKLQANRPIQPAESDHESIERMVHDYLDYRKSL